VRNTQILVEVTRESQLIVCLVNCVQQIYDNHKYVDAASIANEAWRARSGLGITSANENCVQSSLNVASNQLICVSVYSSNRVNSEYMFLTPGRKYQPAKERKPLADIVVECMLEQTTRITPQVVISSSMRLSSALV
jgi:hypothetical protein